MLIDFIRGFEKFLVLTRLFHRLYMFFRKEFLQIFLAKQKMSNTNLTVTGVDLGSSAVKIAAVLKGGVQIITNEANFRQTPNVVGMGQKERLIGQAGQVKIKSNHSNTVTAPSRYLGFDKPCEYLNQELKFCPARHQKLQGQKQGLSFNLLYGQQRQAFTTQQLVASYITEIQKIIGQTNNLQNRNMVLAIPTYFTQHERKALLNAVEITKKKMNNEYSTQLVNEEVAVSMDYGYSKRNQFSEDLQKAKKVLFIDFGHSKANAFVTAFNKQHFRVIDHKFERQLGCKFMDEALLNFYANMFDQAHPNMDLNLMQSKKSVLKILQAIEKQRKVLSGNLEHDLSIECLLEDEDLYYSMKREEFQKICQPVIQKFKKMLLEFLNGLKQKGITFDSIELIGGGTRIPAIINVIAQVFEQQPSRTINSNQCVAKGAALISAMNSSIFRVQPYSFFTTSPYAIEVKINDNKVQKNLIDKNELLVKEKQFEFEVDQTLENFELKIEYASGQIEEGLETRILECKVELKSQKQAKKVEQTEMKEQSTESSKVKLSISAAFDMSGLLILSRITSKTPGFSVVFNKVNAFQKYTHEQISVMQQKQKQMTIQDMKLKKFYQKKNEYESLIYKNKSNIDSFVQANGEYISGDKINEIKFLIESEENELNNQDDEKFGDFAKREKAINHKIEEFFGLTNQLKHLHISVNAQLQKLANLLNQIIQKRSENMYPPEVNQAGQWINQIFQKQKQSPKYNPPVVSVQQVKQVHQDLINKINEFDKQMQRQRQAQMRKTRQPQYQPRGTVFRPENYYGHSYNRPQQDQYYRPKTTRNNKNTYNSSPFGSFFGSGLSGFF